LFEVESLKEKLTSCTNQFMETSAGIMHYYKRPAANGKANKVFLFIHGYAIHQDWYTRYIEPILSDEKLKDVLFLGPNLFGHGPSSGARGQFDHGNQLQGILEILNAEVSPDAEIFVSGHSFGGLLGTLLIERSQTKTYSCAGSFVGSALLAPALRTAEAVMIKTGVPDPTVLPHWLLNAVNKAAKAILPPFVGLTNPIIAGLSQIISDDHDHSASIVWEHLKDPCYSQTVPAHDLVDLPAGQTSLDLSQNSVTNCLIIHTPIDKATSYEASVKFCQAPTNVLDNLSDVPWTEMGGTETTSKDCSTTVGHFFLGESEGYAIDYIVKTVKDKAVRDLSLGSDENEAT
jgi:alpha-beta hydrolase superfamily lysophospholipase